MRLIKYVKKNLTESKTLPFTAKPETGWQNNSSRPKLFQHISAGDLVISAAASSLILWLSWSVVFFLGDRVVKNLSVDWRERKNSHEQESLTKSMSPYRSPDIWGKTMGFIPSSFMDSLLFGFLFTKVLLFLLYGFSFTKFPAVKHAPETQELPKDTKVY